jgi:hypothetical protein
MASVRTDKGEPAVDKPSLPPVDRGARSLRPRPYMLAPGAALPRIPGGGADLTDGHQSLENEIAEIQRLSLDDLRTRWRNLTGRLAPKYLSRSLLMRILAYRLQSQSFGDLDRNTARALARWDEPSEGQRPIASPAPDEAGEPATVSVAPERRTSEPLILKTGTLLTREWQGRMETVMVVADGFAWNGEIFASLSAVAQAMTGTKWNGHRFFGVRPQDRAPAENSLARAAQPDLSRKRQAKASSFTSRANGALP